MTHLDRLIRTLFKLIEAAETKHPERDFTEAKQQTRVLSELLRLAALGSGEWEVVELYTEMIRHNLALTTDPAKQEGYRLVLDAIEAEFSPSMLN